MPVQQPTPLPGLGAVIKEQNHRMAVLEQYRISPGGISLPSASYTSPLDGLEHDTGWSYTFTVGLTGVYLVFTQVDVVWNSLSFEEVLFFLSINGGTPIFTGGAAVGGTSSPFPFTTSYTGLATPNSQVNVDLWIQNESSAPLTTYSAPFIVAWPL